MLHHYLYIARTVLVTSGVGGLLFSRLDAFPFSDGLSITFLFFGAVLFGIELTELDEEEHHLAIRWVSFSLLLLSIGFFLRNPSLTLLPSVILALLLAAAGIALVGREEHELSRELALDRD